MNKELIKQRFARNLATYNENAKIQRLMAQKLISLIDRTDFDNILEIGCGTGLLTELAIQKFKYKNYYANDFVTECKEYIENIDPNIQFIPFDIEKCIDNTNAKYDLIISNAAFQWIDNPADFINKLFSKLNPCGILLFSTFGKENFREVCLASGETLEYYSRKDYEIMLKKSPHCIEEEIRIEVFKTPKDVLRHIKFTGVNAIEKKIWTKTDLRKFENTYKNLCPSLLTLTYNPLYVKIENK